MATNYQVGPRKFCFVRKKTNEPTLVLFLMEPMYGKRKISTISSLNTTWVTI